MTANLEKIFFNWILKNPEHFKNVQGFYFENEDIKFVYDVVRNEYLTSNDKIVPGKLEITNLVKLYDKQDKISLEFIKALLKIDFSEYRDEFVQPRFKAWVLSNSTIAGLVNSIEDIKGLDRTDYNKVQEAVSKVRTKIEDAINIQLEKGSIGLDFDDPDSHDQELAINKITSGYQCIDQILEGGWDRKTLNVWMGSPGSGKSLTLQNIAVNACNAGYNVAYISLELSDKKCMKRVGSMRLEIPIKEYTELAKDKEFIKDRIAEMNRRRGDGVFEQKPGKFYIKEFPSGSATLTDIKKYLKQVKEEAGIDIDMLVVDYIQIMGCEKGVDRNMLYLKGEHLAVGLRAIAQQHNLVCMTATQLAKDKYGANNIELNDMPESKAIADTADTVWGIILTNLMKAENKYHWKWLKLRDNATDYERVMFHFNKLFLRLHSDSYVESTL